MFLFLIIEEANQGSIIHILNEVPVRKSACDEINEMNNREDNTQPGGAENESESDPPALTCRFYS